MKNEVCYFIDKEKRTIVCKITGCANIARTRLNKLAPHFDHYGDDYENFLIPNEFVGVAKCAPEDEWNEEFGMKLALNRAKRKRGIAINHALIKACNLMRKELEAVTTDGIHTLPARDELN